MQRVNINRKSNSYGSPSVPRCNKMIILIGLLVIIVQGHLIISVTPSNSIVSANNQLAIRILTTSAIANNTLAISLTTDFGLAAPCLLNGTAIPCSFTTSTTGNTVNLAPSLITSTFYVVILNVTNPIYASNFPLSASTSGIAFANTGLITISAKTITCSLTPSSQLVGDTPVGYFQMNNDALPANSIISINSTLQTTFPNLFNPSPLCTINNGSFACSLSTSFGQQFLTIASPPQGANLAIAISTINNPPYNGSFLSIGIQIQNTAGFFMQTCSFTQQAVTTLRNSSGLSLINWNNQIGATSTVAATLSTFFRPYTTSLLWVFPNSLSVTVLTPASSILTAKNSTIQNYITGASAVGNSLTFSAQITNPTSVQSLASEIYVVFSPTQFIERLVVSTMTLSPLTFSPSIVLSENRTQFGSVYNVSFPLPYSISGFLGTISISFGTLSCSSLSLVSSISITNSACSSNSLIFSSSSVLPAGTFWISFNVQNYFSTRTNALSIGLTSPFPHFFQIGSGSTGFSLVINNHSFAITNSITTFAAKTSFNLVESSSVSISNTLNRFITISLPKDIIISSNTTISAVTPSIVYSYSVNLTSSTITLNSTGPINITIDNIANPIKYNGSLLWTISAADPLGNPSSLSVSQQQPMYTSTSAFLNYTLTDTTIEATTLISLTIIPALQYFTPPNIIITFSDSLVLSCSNCTIISSTSFFFPYISAIMRIPVTIKNSNNPLGNSISLTITDGVITYETASISYQLTPMTYGFIAYQTGMYQSVGNVNITITTRPTQALTLVYSDLSGVLSSPICVTCTSTQLIFSGIVQYFQTFTVTLTGTYNGTIYAKASVPIIYICQAIQGCNICINQTSNLSTILICQQCFSNTLSPYYLLYNNQCLQKCPISTYSNGLTCVACPNLCYICTMYECQQCVNGYYIYDNTCVNACPAPLINNATHCIAVPIQCPNNCANCPSNNVCEACDGGYYLLNNICYSSCPLRYIPSEATCIPFTPPQETSYFPFPFIISSALIFIALVAMKRFQKRSLVMGNLIAFVSVVEVGSMIMTLNYTLSSSQDLATQALCFILLFSKVLLNLIFLCYFLKIIAAQEQFQAWKEADESHEKLYKALITLSSILSFQIIRIIYSRLLGLRLFFGKFNTALIFKPLNYFTITYFLTSGGALVALSVRSILLQDGYHTSAFFSSIQSIIIQGLLLIICIVDNKKGYDDEFFEYQIYKVNNQYEHSHIDPIDIQHQEGQNAGSMHEMLNATSSALPKIRKKGSQIVRNPRWVKKIAKPIDYPEQSVKEVEDIDEGQGQAQQQERQNEEKNGKVQMEAQAYLEEQKGDGHMGFIENKKQSIFRRKIIEDWRKIQQSLPNKMHQLRNGASKHKNKSKKHSISPQSKRKAVKLALKRVCSVDKVEDLKLPQQFASIPEKIKVYFRQHSPVKRKQTNNPSKLSKKDKVQHEQPKSLNIDIEQQSSQDKQQSIQGLLLNSTGKVRNQPYRGKEYSIDDHEELLGSEVQVQKRRRRRVNQHIVEQMPSETHIGQSVYGQQTQKQARIVQDQFSHNRVLNGQMQSDKDQDQGQQIQQNDLEFESSSQKRINLGNYRYKGEEQKEKHYKAKKRRVNRQTEQVYLQRLVASSEKKTRNLRHRKLQF